MLPDVATLPPAFAKPCCIRGAGPARERWRRDTLRDGGIKSPFVLCDSEVLSRGGLEEAGLGEEGGGEGGHGLAVGDDEADLCGGVGVGDGDGAEVGGEGEGVDEVLGEDGGPGALQDVGDEGDLGVGLEGVAELDAG